MNSLRWKVIKHSDITEDELRQIVQLKDQHWPYGLESQKHWIDNNIIIDDYHLCGMDDNILVAYMAIVHVDLEIDSQRIDCLGLSNVCVDKNVEKKGFGGKLVSEANRFIIAKKLTGLLLCKESLVPFYQKYGWRLLDYVEASVGGVPYDKRVMIYANRDLNDVDFIIINRNF